VNRRPFRLPSTFGRNVFKLLPPGQNIIARAHRAGVDTTSLPAIRAWREAGEPKEWTCPNQSE
jgi:hypothetical protein